MVLADEETINNTKSIKRIEIWTHLNNFYISPSFAFSVKLNINEKHATQTMTNAGHYYCFVYL